MHWFSIYDRRALTLNEFDRLVFSLTHEERWGLTFWIAKHDMEIENVLFS